MKLRFLIRDLLWLTLVVALCFGWWLDRSRLAERISEIENVHLEYIEAIDTIRVRGAPSKPSDKDAVKEALKSIFGEQK